MTLRHIRLIKLFEIEFARRPSRRNRALLPQLLAVVSLLWRRPTTRRGHRHNVSVSRVMDIDVMDIDAQRTM